MFANIVAGFSPILNVVSDGTREVLQVAGWTGGVGTAPSTGMYLGSTGYVNNITDGINIKGADGTGAGASIFGSTGNISFANSNGISFGGSNSIITASYTVPQTTQFQLSADMTNYLGTGAAGSFQFTSAMSLYQPTSLMSNYQSTGAYLTTAMQSNAGSNFLSTSQSSLFQQTSQMSLYQATSLMSNYQSTGAYLTTAMQSNAGSNFVNTSQSSLFQQTSQMSNYQSTGNYLTSQSNQAFSASGSSSTFQTLQFGNSNGVSFSISNGSLVGTVKTDYQSSGNYLTTAMQSNAATISNIKVSAGTLSANRSDITFSNGNGVSFGLETNGVITASVATAAAAQTAISGLSAGTTQITSGTASFANSNGITFGINGNTITATVKTDYQSSGNYLTTAMASNAGSNFVGLNSALTANGVSATINSSGVSLNFPAFLTTAMQSNQSSNFAGIGFTSASTAGTNIVATLSTNGLSMGIPNYVTNAAGGGITNVNISAGTTSQNLSNFVFSNSNNVSFGLSGSTITASINAGAGGGIALANSQTTYTSGTANLIASGALTIGSTTGQSFYFSAPSQSSLSATGQLSISVNGSTISMGVPDPLTLSYFNPQDAYVQAAGVQGQNSLHIQPMQVPNVQFDRIIIPIIASITATSATATFAITYRQGLYTRNNSTLSLLSSWSSNTSFQYGTSNSSIYGGGLRLFSIATTGTILEGQYWVANIFSTSSAGANALSFSQILASQMNSNLSGHWGSANDATNQYTRGLGVYTVSTASIPSSIAFSQINGTASMVLRKPIFYFISGTI